MKPVSKKLLCGVSLALTLTTCISVAQADAVVIVNPDNPLTELSGDDLAHIYLGKLRKFPDGGSVEPFDQRAGSALRTEFYRDHLDMTEAQAKRHWSKLMFSGKGRPPSERSDDAAMKSTVAGDPAAIGYIDVTSVDDSVKVLTVKP